MFIVDSHKFFKAELREPDAEELSEAIGFAIYSNSKVQIPSNQFLNCFGVNAC